MVGWLVGGVICCAVGIVWIGQGIGVIHGSFMTGQALWAVIGVLTLLVGCVLLGRASVVRKARRAGDE